MKTLYPSLDGISTSQVASEAVRNTRIKFGGINYERLYVTLVLGPDLLHKLGMGHIVPTRGDKLDITSLTAKTNKDLSVWIINENFTDADKREMVALLVQVTPLILIYSHTYSFGGKFSSRCQEPGLACVQVLA